MSFMREPNAEPIPGYRLIEPLGSGGFGEAWKCEAPGGLFKAIKFVFGNLNSLDVDGARAEQELKALKRVKEVRHPFVLSMDRIEVVDGELVIVMELADRSLHDAFEECLAAGLVGIPRDTLLRYIRDAAEGLDHMNEKHNLQHLDIKPRNLFLVSDRVKVGDFGLVKHLERSGASGMLGGVTPLYAAAGNLHRRHQRPQRPVQPGHRLPGTAHRPAAVQRQERPPAGPAAHERGAGPARPAGGGTARRRPRPGQGPGQALPQLPGLRPRPVHGPLGRPAAVDRRRHGAGRQPAQDHGRHHGGHPAGADVRRGRRHRRLADGRGSPARTPDVGRRAPDEASRLGMTVAQPSTGALRPTLVIGLGGFGRRALLELRCRFLDRFGDLDKMPLVRFLYIDVDAEAVKAATRGSPEVALKAGEVYHLPLAAGVALPPPPAGPPQRLAAAREAVHHAALPQDAGVARPRPAGLRRQLPAAHGPLPPRDPAGHAPRRPLPVGQQHRPGPARQHAARLRHRPRPAAAPAAA